MKELFFPDGHLTDEALQGLMDGTLDELARLEVGEHLSFCDACLDRYTALLTADILEEPETHQTLPVMRKVHKRQINTATRRYATAAAAVAIGSVLWYTGIFNIMGKALVQSPTALLGTDYRQEQNIAVQEIEPFEERNSLSNAIRKAVDEWSIRVKDAAAPAFRAPAQKREDAPQINHEKLEDQSI